MRLTISYLACVIFGRFLIGSPVGLKSLWGVLLLTCLACTATLSHVRASTDSSFIREFSTANLTTGAVRIKWHTSAEVGSWSFALYRADGLIANHKMINTAQKITPEAIMANGQADQGASYEYIDITAEAGRAYTYWLVETESDGHVNIYGPALHEGRDEYKVYLSFIRK